MNKLLTFPDSAGMALSIRAKALLFHDQRSSQLLEQVERIARSDATALIVGETGTGKELIARHLHTQSGRKGPFIAVNCGAFSETLIDAELFGHETGAFTGATQARSGWFEAANGGTLFLDEIGDLSPALQVKLLRVLQERQVVRLGSRRPIALDVRLVAATNVDLPKAVLAERFRADLFYRLSVATIDLPPLCERPGDILPLARHFVEMYSAKMRMDGVELADDAQGALLAYEWPGNIRELENVIHYALIVCLNGQIRADDLKLVGALHRSRAYTNQTNHTNQASQANPGHQAGGAGLGAMADAAPLHAGQAPIHAAQAPLYSARLPVQAAQAPGQGAEAPGLPQLYQRLEALVGELIRADDPGLFDAVEETLVRTVFAHCHQNQVQSARVLGISRNMLRTHLKHFGLIGSEPLAVRVPAGVLGRAVTTH